jgi:hypothetical protein
VPNKKYIIAIVLLISLVGNIYLFITVIKWQKAWLAQIMTTSDIETIFRKSGADISFEALQKIAKEEYPSTFKVLPSDVSQNDFGGPYENIILIDETKLYFRNNRYVGSKANVPPEVEFWSVTNEF